MKESNPDHPYAAAELAQEISELSGWPATSNRELLLGFSMSAIYDLAGSLEVVRRVDETSLLLLPYSAAEIEWLALLASESADRFYFDESIAKFSSQDFGRRMMEWLQPVPGGPYEGQAQRFVRCLTQPAQE